MGSPGISSSVPSIVIGVPAVIPAHQTPKTPEAVATPAQEGGKVPIVPRASIFLSDGDNVKAGIRQQERGSYISRQQSNLENKVAEVSITVRGSLSSSPDSQSSSSDSSPSTSSRNSLADIKNGIVIVDQRDEVPTALVVYSKANRESRASIRTLTLKEQDDMLRENQRCKWREGISKNKILIIGALAFLTLFVLGSIFIKSK